MTDQPIRINLSDDRKARLIEALQGYFLDEFDEELSQFRAEGMLDFLLVKLGPPVYNQGVRDACEFVQKKLVDIEGEVYEPDRP